MILYFIIMGISLFLEHSQSYEYYLFFGLIWSPLPQYLFAMKRKKIIIDEIVVLFIFIFIQNLFLAFNSTSLTFFQRR